LKKNQSRNVTHQQLSRRAQGKSLPYGLAGQKRGAKMSASGLRDPFMVLDFYHQLYAKLMRNTRNWLNKIITLGAPSCAL